MSASGSDMRQDFLIELGTEELPPKALPRLSAAFSRGLLAGLDAAGFNHGESRAFATPRRLALLIQDLAGSQPEQTIDRLGPAVAAAFDDDGVATPAAEGFARSYNASVEQLERRQTDKGERLAYRGRQAGQSLAELLPAIVTESLRALPIPKRMRWGSGEQAFVRPVHWLLCLHGQTILPLECFGCAAGNRTRGHRFHHPDALIINNPADYERQLESPGRVVAHFARRREMITESVAAVLARSGGNALITEDLLNEVTALVEWPVALSGTFEARFLVLPREVIVSVLEGHQRYFPVSDDEGKLLPQFVTVANLESREPERVVSGNERVIRPRLADALFFWEQDTATGLETMALGLAQVSYESALGSMADKSSRVARISTGLADMLAVDTQQTAMAARLCKADLMSSMVGEFPELQGLMGGYYARHAGLPDAVSQAIAEHYAPAGAGATLPVSPSGRILALADKLDTLAGIFAIGKKPSGDKDPFALRRAALGVLRILIEGGLDLSLRQACRLAVEQQPMDVDQAAGADTLMGFFAERLRAWYTEQGIAAEQFAAVLASGLDSPLDFHQRLKAVAEFASSNAATALGEAHKRVRNILKNKDNQGVLDHSSLSLDAEKQLHAALGHSGARIESLTQAGHYHDALQELAGFQKPVAAFFDQVMVMSEDARERENRLALLRQLDTLCRSVADISLLSVE